MSPVEWSGEEMRVEEKEKRKGKGTGVRICLVDPIT